VSLCGTLMRIWIIESQIVAGNEEGKQRRILRTGTPNYRRTL